MTKYLIVNADDFGLTSGVNRGILDCHQAGSVSNASLMVNTPAVHEAVDIARSNPRLGVGLHLNLTLGRPLNSPDDVPSLTGKDGCFFSRSRCERRLVLGLLTKGDIEREFNAQVERFNSYGLPMTHIDSHQHVHIFPRVFDIVAEYCRKNDLPLRIPWRWKGPRLGLRRRLRIQLRDLLVFRNVRKWDKAVKTNAGFGSIFDLVETPESIVRESYLNFLKKLQDSPFELLVHPALVDEELKRLTKISEFSLREHQVLARFSLGLKAGFRGFRLVSYAEAFPKSGGI